MSASVDEAKLTGTDQLSGTDATDSARTRSNKSVLFLNDEWGTSKGGISTVHRQLVNQAKNAGYSVYVTALELSEEDKEDAEKKGIEVILPKKKGKDPPNLEWIKTTHKTYFPDLGKIPDLKVIVGHIPITSEGALDIRNDHFSGKGVKVFLFNHVIPEDIEDWKPDGTPQTTQEKRKRILKQAESADAVFSVGPKMFNYFDNDFRGLDHPPTHFRYIPYPDDLFFDIINQIPKEDNPVTNVLTVGRVDGVGQLKGYDVMAAAMSEVCDDYKKSCSGQPPTWVIRGIPEGKHKESLDFIKKHVTSPHLNITPRPYGTQEDIKQDMKTSHLFVMPSRTEPFGMVGMEAIAAGLPTLLTCHSGLADLVVQKNIFGKRDGESMVVDVGVNDTNLKGDIETWRKAIMSVLRDDREEAFEHAQKLKGKLKGLPAIEKTHQDFIKQLAE